MAVSLSIKKQGDWKLAEKMLADLPERVDKAVHKAIDQEALYLVGQVKKKLRSGPFEPLAKATITLRQLQGFSGKKPLIRSGDMRNAVTRVWDGDTVFIGIPRTAVSADGQSYVDIADIHENGCTFAMRVTPAMRRFWFGVLFKGEPPQPGGGSGMGIVIIHIPPRPFLAPVLNEEGPQVPGRLEERIGRLLGFT